MSLDKQKEVEPLYLGECVLEDAFRIDEYDDSDNSYLVTSLLAEAVGFHSYPKDRSEMLLLQKMQDVGEYKGIKSCYVNIQYPVFIGNVYYGSLVEDPNYDQKILETLSIERKVEEVNFLITSLDTPCRFLSMCSPKYDPETAKFSIDPDDCYRYGSVDNAKDWLFYFRESSDKPTNLDVCLVYDLVQRIEVCCLGF